MPRCDAVRGGRAIAHLRQPAWDAEWYQVLSVVGDRIVDLTDYDSLDEAQAAAPSH